VLKHYALPLLVLYIIALTILSLVSIGRMPSLGSSFDDKVFHAIAYFFLTLLSFNFLRTKNEKNALLLSVVIAVIYGIIIELLQNVTNTRVTDFYDVVANCVGIGLAILAMLIKKLILK